MGTLEFLAAYPIWTVLLIIVAGLICIFKFIDWCKKLWTTREDFKNEARIEGEQHQKTIDKEEEAAKAEEERIKKLEKAVSSLTILIEKQQQQIDLLIRSDELDIKAWIQQQHEKWMALQCIDSQSLDLVIKRGEIYTEEGGNGWAERMIQDIKALPVLTVIPVQPNNSIQN